MLMHVVLKWPHMGVHISVRFWNAASNMEHQRSNILEI